jgi:hypothetical protein
VATTVNLTGSGGTSDNPKDGDWSDANNWSPAGVPGDGDTVNLGGGFDSNAYTVTLDTSSADLDSINIGGLGGFPTLDIQSSGILNVTNTVTVGNAFITMEGGEISANAMDLAQPDSSLSGFGTLNISDSYTGTGTIDAKGGTLEVEGDVGGNIQLKIDSAPGSDLKLDNQVGTSGNPGTVTFAPGGDGILDLTGEGRGPHGETALFHDTVVGFAAGDEIEVKGQSGDSLSYDAGTQTLTVNHGSHVEETIKLSGTYTQGDFHISAGNTDIITVNTTCFMAGTKIATPGGSVPVEALKRGDLVLTADARAVPVGWLGRQTVSTVFGDPLRVLPIRIKAGAISENVPSRDLLLSPDHAILVDGTLIQAGALVNGTSFVREDDVPQTFTYYHVEVDDHALILAENTPAETFVDNVERLAFDNWAEHQALYPEGKSITELPYPRAKSHRQVPVNIRVKLAERAQAIGAAVGGAAVA